MNATNPSPAPEPPNSQQDSGLTKADIVPIMILDQLEDLRRMRVVGMNFIERLERRASGLLRIDEQEAFNDRSDICLGFTRVSRAVRQIIVLEQETAGLRQPPLPRPVNTNTPPMAAQGQHARPEGGEPETLRDREGDDLNDYDDYDDYDDAPVDEVIAQVREQLASFGGGADRLFSLTSRPGSTRASTRIPKSKDVDHRPARNAPACITQEAAFGGGSGDDEIRISTSRTHPSHGRDPP